MIKVSACCSALYIATLAGMIIDVKAQNILGTTYNFTYDHDDYWFNFNVWGTYNLMTAESKCGELDAQLVNIIDDAQLKEIERQVEDRIPHDWTEVTLWTADSDNAEAGTNVILIIRRPGNNRTNSKINKAPTYRGHGYVCQKKNERGCTNSSCDNGGTCVDMGGGGMHCVCASGFAGERCEEVDNHGNHSMCEYTSCFKGTCKSYDGTEICSCENTGYTGMLCEIPIGKCTNSSCDNGGLCVDTGVGGRYCVCQSGFVGVRCEKEDSSANCATVGEGDIIFLPRCSLKQSLDMFATCINEQLPYLDHTCSAKVWRSVQCIYKSLQHCSGLLCQSAYEYGGVEIANSIGNELFNPVSPFMTQVYELLCTPPMNGTGFPSLNKTLNIGSPVCTGDIVDRLIAAFIATGNKILMPGADSCSELDELRMEMYQIANASCNWDKIYEALAKFNISGGPENYWSDVLRITHQEFLNWIIPDCKGSEMQCPPNYCEKGHCNAVANGDYFCTCLERYTGDRCQHYDESAVCPMPRENDVEFFPMCTLRKTVNKTMQCLSGLTHQLFGQAGSGECSMALYKAMECVGHMVGNCSKLACKSIYNLPGASETVQNIFTTLFDPTFSGGLTAALCRPDGGQMILEYIRNAFHGMNMNNTMDTAIGMICPGFSFRNVTFGIERIVEMIGQSTSLRQTCSILDTARQQAYQTLTSSCNLQILEGLGQLTGHGEIISYVTKGVNIVISMLHDYTLPMCIGIDGGTGDDGFCPCITHSSSPSEVIDAYKCSVFVYSKTVSHWVESMIQWGRSRGVFNRNWNEFASMLGLRRCHGMAMGGHGFLEMIRANMECGYTSSMDCNRGHKYLDVLGCLHCYRSAAAGGDGRSMLMEWTRLYRQSMFLNKVYQTLLMEMGESGGGVDPSMPPFTDFTRWSTTSSYPSGSSSWSPSSIPGSSPPWSTSRPPASFPGSLPPSATTRPPASIPGFSPPATTAASIPVSSPPSETTRSPSPITAASPPGLSSSSPRGPSPSGSPQPGRPGQARP